MIESRYFSAKEQSCSCCNQTKDNTTLMTMLTSARIKAGVPFVITSWYRCERHNHAIGSNSTSSHIDGQAVDIAFKNSVDKFNIVSALIWAGFQRIGINDKLKFIHADVSTHKISPVLFTY